MSLRPYLVDLLLVQVKDLSRRSGGDLLVGPVAWLRAVATVPGQDEHHLWKKSDKGPVERV